MRTVVPGPCPCCNTEIEYLYQTENIPYFSDILIISAICPPAGTSYVDTQVLKHTDPMRYTAGGRVGRRSGSPGGAGARAPASRSRSWVSGSIPARLRGFRIQRRGGPRPDREGRDRERSNWGNDEEQENARALLDRIAAGKDAGHFPITLILEDPIGNERHHYPIKAKKEGYDPEPNAGPEE